MLIMIHTILSLVQLVGFLIIIFLFLMWLILHAIITVKDIYNSITGVKDFLRKKVDKSTVPYDESKKKNK